MNRAATEGLPAELFDDQVEPFDSASTTRLGRLDIGVGIGTVVAACAATAIVLTGAVGTNPTTFAAVLVANMADRIGAVGGSVSVRSTPGEGTTVEGRLALHLHDRVGEEVANV